MDVQYWDSLPEGTETARSAREPRLRGLFAGSALGDAVPRAEKFGDLITADHRVLNEDGESRNNHRYAVVAQDLATKWIQSYPCRTKTSKKTERGLRKFHEPSEKPKVIFSDNSLEFGKSCESLSWNHCGSTPHRSETNGIAERAVRRIKEGTSAVLLQSGLDEKCWDGKTLYERRLGEPFKGPLIPFGPMVEYHHISSKDQSRLHQFGNLDYSLYKHCVREEFGKVTFWSQTLRSWKMWTRQRLNAKEVITPKKGEQSIFPIADGTVKLSGRDQGIRKSTSTRYQPVRSEELSGDLQGSSDKSQPTDEMTDDAEASNDFWSIEGNTICRHQVEPRVQLSVPKEETFPTPTEIHWRDQDYTRTTLDLLQESPTDDSWNVDVDRNGDFTKIQATARSDCLWWNLVRHVKSSSEKREARMGYWKSEAR